jgi:hypothetical protein
VTNVVNLTVDYLEPNNEFGDVNATVDGGGVTVVPYGTHVDLSVPAYELPGAREPGKCRIPPLCPPRRARTAVT